jgi:hypothetical protein
MSFLGILLALLALTRLVIDKNDSHHFRIALLLSVLLFSFASFVAIRSMLYLREYDLNATVNLHAFLEFHLNYLIAMCVILFLICCNVSTDKKNFLALASVILSIVYAIYSSRWDKTGISFGFFSYAYRSMGAFMFSGLIALAWLIKYFPKLENHRLFRVDTLRSAVLVSSLFAVTATPMIFHSYGFFAWLKKFENEAIMVDGLVPVDLTSIARNQSSVSGYNWPWTNSTLSVLLRGNAVGIVINGTTFTGWETFDPKTIDKFPLSNYRKDSYFSK